MSLKNVRLATREAPMVHYARERLAAVLIAAGYGERRGGKNHVRLTEVCRRAEALAKHPPDVPTVPGLKYLLEKGRRSHRGQLALLARVARADLAFITGETPAPHRPFLGYSIHGERLVDAAFDPLAPPLSVWAEIRFRRKINRRVDETLNRLYGPAGADGRRPGEPPDAWRLAAILSRLANPAWWTQRLLQPRPEADVRPGSGAAPETEIRVRRIPEREQAAVQLADAFTIILKPWLDEQRSLRPDVLALLSDPEGDVLNLRRGRG